MPQCISFGQFVGENLARTMRKQQPGRDHSQDTGSVDEDKVLSSEEAAGQTNCVEGRQQKLRKILNSVLTGDVLPKVFEASGGDTATKQRMERQTLDAFRHFVLEGDRGDCIEFVQGFIDSGTSLRSMCLGLFTVTAQELGELWDADTLSFAEVTMGLGRLHELVHHFSAVDISLKSPRTRHNILLASAPAEQHAFGVLLVSKIFEMEGWLVTGGPDLHTGEDLTALVSRSWFDIVGLSASTEDMAYSLSPEIEKIRAASLNPDVFVMVGGSGFASSAEAVRLFGADELAQDADDAILKARALLRDRERTSKV